VIIIPQKSIYVKQLDKIYWDKLEEIANKKGMSNSEFAMKAIKEHLRTHYLSKEESRE